MSRRAARILAVCLIGGTAILAGACRTTHTTFPVAPELIPRPDVREHAKVAPPPTVTEPLPYLRVDSVNRTVDVDAVVVYDGTLSSNDETAVDWLELVACTPGGKEYESLVAVLAQPSHIHQALLMIGLVPGSPLRLRTDGDGGRVIAPTGPRVAVHVVLESAGTDEEFPVGHWVLNQTAERTLSDSTWLFTGSAFRMIDGRSVYMADAEGSVISLVNFGGDLLSRSTLATNQDDGQAWAANKRVIPPKGTPVVIRLRAVSQAGSGPE